MNKLDAFQGHLIFYCKGQYGYKDFFDGLKRIWALRCGYDYEENEGDRCLEYVADDMIKILKAYNIDIRLDIIHRELANQTFKPESITTPIRALIWEYGSLIRYLRVKERDVNTGEYEWIIPLPKPNKFLFYSVLNAPSFNKKLYNLVKKTL